MYQTAAATDERGLALVLYAKNDPPLEPQDRTLIRGAILGFINLHPPLTRSFAEQDGADAPELIFVVNLDPHHIKDRIILDVLADGLRAVLTKRTRRMARELLECRLLERIPETLAPRFRDEPVRAKDPDGDDDDFVDVIEHFREKPIISQRAP